MKRDQPAGGVGRVRIIAGSLRGSKLEVAPLPGLRPTSDRVRETLFNWLAPILSGARCLDLFAGSGALGFEAASRGAAAVTLVERDPRAVAMLRTNAERLRTAAVRVETGDALAWLSRPVAEAAGARFDIVFVDPPFDAGLHERVLAALGPWLMPEGMVYVESARATPITIPPEWRLHREGATREVRYALYRLPPEPPATLRAGSTVQDLA
jgi:16S rRNA (guanine966-N2)-methyltransferase